jgi:hypothetical protein
MATKRVRVAVAIDEDGDWDSCSAHDGADQDAAILATEALDSYTEGRYQAVHFIEANIPVPVAPESQTVEGKVENG